MKIRGKQKFEVPRKVVRLVRTTSGPQGEAREELPILVRALPVGTETKMFDLFPEPVKPQEYAKDSKGVILRDDNKKPIIRDVESTEWREANTRARNGRLAYVIYHGIEDPEVEKPELPANAGPDFYVKFFEELVEFGLTMGDLGKLMAEITGLMNLAEDVEAERSS